MNNKHKALTAIGSAAIITFIAVSWIFGPTINQYFLQRQAANDMNQKIQDAEYAIDNYEWFKQQKQDIESMRNKIENQRVQIRNFKDRHNMSDLNRYESTQYNRMTTRLLGYKNQHENLVADYNARSNMQTRNVFKGKLPYEMEKKFWTGDLVP